ncbi:hypothetical protein HWQ46_18580 [Shewanella sp. D64]|uniref:hypothetical protein n=1 Tax=unclassified Shewanella TaxID=196818 RepID=UPI0022BA11EE|nr:MULTISPECIES: hypothetical protein [unclassified Shewanella]MEC4727554.1 hypothetical protein [Shewanella sp. D64]MEC4739805.1 hypothetical protein [Shewanella sp. E94]WBJ95807.1 hypothetical protein HWQ47_01315 [Shewanella sp. MTB7]
MSLLRTAKPITIHSIQLLLTLFIATLIAPSYADSNAPLPLGAVLDSQGNPIPLPSKQESALEIPSLKPSKTIRSTQHKLTNNTPRTKPKKRSLSAKQRLASRVRVANDPSCRWLDTRMVQLERELTYKGNSRSRGYHQKELNIREREWKCMKCSTEGPSLVERDKCQYKR